MEINEAQLKQKVLDRIEQKLPVRTAMFLKNWKRYILSVKLFIRASGVKQSDTILDYGCGFPFIVFMLRDLGYNITGYEPYAGDEELEMSALLGLEQNYTTKLNADERFDHILMIDVIEHLSVIKPVMESIYDLTTAGGGLFVSTPNVMRFDMWKKFVFRRTGHPTPLQTFLTSDDNYRNHQREFTLDELVITLKHFKFTEITLRTVEDTQPGIDELNAYHKLLGDKKIFKRSAGDSMQHVLLKLLPASVQFNNLFVYGRKK